MTPSEYVISSLATLMWNESKEDGVLGMTLCGLVVRNRALAGWNAGQWIRLIEDHDKFHFGPDASPRVLVHGDPYHDILFRRCIAAAENIFNGRERDISEGALWYARLDDCPEWFRENIVRPSKLDENGQGMLSHAMIAKVGRHTCFK